MKMRNGFTLVEASLVLGVAGLIFLMAFIALPALWGTERDAKRRDDVLLFAQKLKDFQTNNNRGALPGFANTTDKNAVESGEAAIIARSADDTSSSTSWNGFYRDFFTQDFADPDGTDYKLRVAKCGATKVDTECNSNATNGLYAGSGMNHLMYVVLGAVCDGNTPKSSSNTRRVAVLYKMERGDTAFCANT